jgi:hypothetical protein
VKYFTFNNPIDTYTGTADLHWRDFDPESPFATTTVAAASATTDANRSVQGCKKKGACQEVGEDVLTAECKVVL